MKPTEAAALLLIAAAFDNRKPDEDQAKAWAMALDGLRFEDCRLAVVEHYKVSTDWLMPATIREFVKRIRHKRLEDFDRICRIEPPAHLADDPRAEIEWHNAITQGVMDGTITHPDQVDSRGELKPRDMSGLARIGKVIPRA